MEKTIEITEDYVSFETAKLLKEKGFDEPCQFLYFSKYKQEGDFFGNFNARKNSEINEASYSAPTIQMAMKWLREVHDVIVNIFYDKDEERWCAEHYRMLIGDYTLIGYYRTYEEACESAIKYCLENLI